MLASSRLEEENRKQRSRGPNLVLPGGGQLGFQQ